MKILESQKHLPGAFGAFSAKDATYYRVRELGTSEPMPEGATSVPDATPVTDWQSVNPVAVPGGPETVTLEVAAT